MAAGIEPRPQPQLLVVHEEVASHAAIAVESTANTQREEKKVEPDSLADGEDSNDEQIVTPRVPVTQVKPSPAATPSPDFDQKVEALRKQHIEAILKLNSDFRKEQQQTQLSLDRLKILVWTLLTLIGLLALKIMLF